MEAVLNNHKNTVSYKILLFIFLYFLYLRWTHWFQFSGCHSNHITWVSEMLIRCWSLSQVARKLNTSKNMVAMVTDSTLATCKLQGSYDNCPCWSTTKKVNFLLKQSKIHFKSMCSAELTVGKSYKTMPRQHASTCAFQSSNKNTRKADTLTAKTDNKVFHLTY